MVSYGMRMISIILSTMYLFPSFLLTFYHAINKKKKKEREKEKLYASMLNLPAKDYTRGLAWHLPYSIPIVSILSFETIKPEWFFVSVCRWYEATVLIPEDTHTLTSSCLSFLFSYLSIYLFSISMSAFS